MDSLISFILFTAACLVFALLASVADRRITATFAIATALYLGLDGIITEIPNLVPSLDFIGGNWNWVGKILSLAFSMVVIISLKTYAPSPPSMACGAVPPGSASSEKCCRMRSSLGSM